MARIKKQDDPKEMSNKLIGKLSPDFKKNIKRQIKWI